MAQNWAFARSDGQGEGSRRCSQDLSPGKDDPALLYFLAEFSSYGRACDGAAFKKTGRGFEPNVRFFYESLQKNLKKVIERRDDREQWFEAEKELHRQIYRGYGEIVPELRRALQIQLTIGTAARALRMKESA